MKPDRSLHLRGSFENSWARRATRIQRMSLHAVVASVVAPWQGSVQHRAARALLNVMLWTIDGSCGLRHRRRLQLSPLSALLAAWRLSRAPPSLCFPPLSRHLRRAAIAFYWRPQGRRVIRVISVFSDKAERESARAPVADPFPWLNQASQCYTARHEGRRNRRSRCQAAA
jgi:hypothetical protein